MTTPFTTREKLLAGLATLLAATTLYFAQPWIPHEPPAAESKPCERHFLRFGGDDLDRCIAQYAKQGLALTAFDPNLGMGGSFEPGKRRWWVRLSKANDIEGTGECENGKIADLRGGTIDSAWALKGSDEGPCKLVGLRWNGTDYSDYVESQAIRKRYVQLVSEEAAKGYAPERVVFLDLTGAGTTPSAMILMRRGDPKDTASIYMATDGEAEAFEKRAAADGFRPLRYERNPLTGNAPAFIDEVWRRRPAQDVLLKKELTEDEFRKVDGELSAKEYRLIDIDSSGESGGGTAASGGSRYINSIWEKP